ncbi:MAG: hypothetical protein ACRDS9_25400 [Pseudonocardiaceae bacterium]
MVEKRSEATKTIKDKAPQAKEKLSGAAKHAADKAKSSSNDDQAPPTDGANASPQDTKSSTTKSV